jgi:hypothetical protein
LALLLAGTLLALLLGEWLARVVLRRALPGGGTVASMQDAVLASDVVVNVTDDLSYDQSRARDGAIARAVIHPYLGYVYLPSDGSAKSLVTGAKFDPPCPINRYGFLGEADLLKNDSADFNVLVLGGSVAQQFFCMSRDTLAAELGKDPRLRGKRVNVLGLSLGGWRQPQQLLAVVYYLTLGGQFDVLADLAGYNEAMDSAGNVDEHVHLDYPGDWDSLGPTLGQDSILRAAGILTLRQERRRLADRFSRARFSFVAQLAWLAWDRSYERRIQQANAEMKAARAQEKRYSFAERGPRIQYPNTKQEIVRLWRETAIQLGRVARANGGQYFEFLQPNQYVPSSKPLGVEERKRSIQEDDALSFGRLNEYYAAFSAEGERLDPELVRFKDLRYVFRGVSEPVYIDTCCHLNEAGNRILASAMAAEIRRHLSDRRPE